MDTIEKQERILLFENTEHRNKLDASAQKLLGLLDELYRAYTELKLQQPVTLEFLYNTAPQRAEPLIREIIRQETPFFATFPGTREAALAMIQLPARFPAFKTALHAIDNHKHFMSTGIFSKIAIEYFGIDQEGVILLPAYETWLNTRTRRYANEGEAALLSELESMLVKLKDIQSRYPTLHLIEGDRAVFFVSKRTGKITIDSSAIRIEEQTEE